ncbi:hypothetical protein D9V63_00400 [Buchnera aphidicola (Aphis nasturtii)]|uniref:hypothetical protein n=1 Tax=Buchnera aphidicola TaxID=9 RepID=UPI0010C2DD33|nr:hypothetical protein [Buchnera aphidicola]QCI18071.1 hypothetical protein D9V63_00400 [Buchnera aphidicola (Aphis nasturtii)]
MGKSNSFNVINKIINKDKEIHNILSVGEIKKLEQINKNFVEKIIIHFSNFVKNNVTLNFFTITINSSVNSKKDIKYLFSNKIDILNLNKKLFIFFSDNLLSLFIDLLFGGNGTYSEKINQERKLTYIEDSIAKKILQFIFQDYFKFFENIFSVDINTLNIKIVNIKKNDFLKENYINNNFHLSLNGVHIFFSILLPISIVKKYFQQTNFLKNNKTSLIKNINFEKSVSVINLYDIELDVIIQFLMSSKIQYKRLSIGDILMVKSPDKVIAYIKKIPIFLGSYKNFNKKSVIFFKKFIDKNIDLHKFEEFFNE